MWAICWITFVCRRNEVAGPAATSTANSNKRWPRLRTGLTFSHPIFTFCFDVLRATSAHKPQEGQLATSTFPSGGFCDQSPHTFACHTRLIYDCRYDTAEITVVHTAQKCQTRFEVQLVLTCLQKNKYAWQQHVNCHVRDQIWKLQEESSRCTFWLLQAH